MALPSPVTKFTIESKYVAEHVSDQEKKKWGANEKQKRTQNKIERQVAANIDLNAIVDCSKYWLGIGHCIFHSQQIYNTKQHNE